MVGTSPIIENLSSPVWRKRTLAKQQVLAFGPMWRKRTLANQQALAFGASISGGLSELAYFARQQKEVTGIEQPLWLKSRRNFDSIF